MHGEVNARALPVSNVVDHSQKMNVAARAKAENKTEAVRDRVNGAIRPNLSRSRPLLGRVDKLVTVGLRACSVGS